MLPQVSEPMGKLKSRFIQALLTPVDSAAVAAGVQASPGKERKHVFDFEDGMRIIASIDIIDGVHYFHISTSGSEEYAKSIKQEGISGLLEDVLLRMAMFTGEALADDVESFSRNGVLHIGYKVDHAEFIERVKRA